MKRLILPGIPFTLSFILSLTTAGSHCGWQDSGFFLVAVKEFGVLYPPGFALYVLLCKAWTLGLGFVDFTYAVHLFSALCAALAAGTLAVAVRDLLRTQGPVFRTTEDQSPLPEWAGASIGCLAACGYTFWAAAILAKVYAFYFLMLSLLLWRMIRADETKAPRDFRIVAALIGLSWQAHPSAALLGGGLIAFIAAHRRTIGGKGIAAGTAVAAACALGPMLLLPLYQATGKSALRFGDPASWSGFTEYLTGSRFTGAPNVWGLEGSRVASVPRYFWEEFLGIGALIVALGLYRLWWINRKLLVGLALWVAPVLVVTVLFKLEGQHDFWMVAAWLPLWLVAGLGLAAVEKLREAAVVLALIGVVWAVAANRSDLNQRGMTTAEALGRYCLEGLEPEASLDLISDDGLALALYLQRVRGERTDVRILGNACLGATPGAGERYAEWPAAVSSPGWSFMPAGSLFKLVRDGQQKIDLKRWREPIPAEEVPALFRRRRGQYVDHTRPGRLSVRPEPYEQRLLRVLLRARANLAFLHTRAGNLPEALRLYESIERLDPDADRDATLHLQFAVCEIGLAKYEPAEKRLKKMLTLDCEERQRAEAYYFLTGLTGARPEAAEWKAKALASPDLAPELRARLQGR